MPYRIAVLIVASSFVMGRGALAEENLLDRCAAASAQAQTSEDAAQAINVCSKLIESDPKSVPGYRGRAVAYMTSGETADALEDLDHAVAIDNTAIESYLMRAYVRITAEDREGGLSDYARVIEIAPNDVRGYSARAPILADAGRPDEALADYDKAIALDPDNPERYRAKADFLDVRQEFDKAADAMTMAISKQPDQHMLYLRRGELLTRSGRKEAALADYAKVVELDPTFGYAARAAHFIETGEGDRAIEDYGRLIALDPAKTDGYVRRAHSYLTMDKVEEALADYNKAIELEPDADWLYRLRIEANKKRGEAGRQLVLNDFAKRIALDPTQPYALQERAAYLREQKDYAGAIADYTRVIDLGSPGKQDYERRAALYLLDGHPGAAADDLSKMIELQPDTIELYWGRGYANLVAGRLLAAASDYVTAFYRGIKFVYFTDHGDASEWTGNRPSHQ